MRSEKETNYKIDYIDKPNGLYYSNSKNRSLNFPYGSYSDVKSKKTFFENGQIIKPNDVPFREKLIHWSGPLIRTAVEKGITATSMEFPEGFDASFKQAISERNARGKRKYSIFIVSRHHSHPDGFIIARLTLDLKAKANSVLPKDEQTAGFFMPLAQSLEDGQQDKPIMKVYHEIKPTMESFGLVPAPIVRAKDKSEYTMEQDSDEEARIRALVAKRYNGVMLFPEGTTTSGKTNEYGQVNGKVNFELNAIKKLYLFLRRNVDTESLFIPAATFGGREILNPDNKWVSPVRLLTALVSPYPAIASIKVGMPIRSDEGQVQELLRGRDRKALNDYFGHIIAGLLPQPERGVYA